VRLDKLKATKETVCRKCRSKPTKNYKQYLLYEKELRSRWQGIKQRCCNDKDAGYKCYGGRGIKVVDAWKNDFETFYQWSIANGYSEGLTIERINVNGNYAPDNCKWITQKEQAYNKQDTVRVEYRGVVKCLAEWAHEFGASYNIVKKRFTQLGWGIERALITPVDIRTTNHGCPSLRLGSHLLFQGTMPT